MVCTCALGMKREQDDEEHHRDEHLADAEPGVDVVAHVLLLRAAVAQRAGSGRRRRPCRRGRARAPRPAWRGPASPPPCGRSERAAACGRPPARRGSASARPCRPSRPGLGLFERLGARLRRCCSGCFATGVLGSVALKITGMTEPRPHRIRRRSRCQRPPRRSERAVDAGFPATVADLAGARAHPLRLVAGLRPGARRRERRGRRRACCAGTGVFDLVEVRRAAVRGRIASSGQPAVVASRAGAQRPAHRAALRPPRRAAARQGRGLGDARRSSPRSAATACTVAARPTTRRA